MYVWQFGILNWVTYGRTWEEFDQFMAQHPNQVFYRFTVLDENGDFATMLALTEEATEDLARQGVISHYAIGPAFDAAGKPIIANSASTPVYTWGVSEDLRFLHAYELEEYHALPEPAGGYAGQPYAYNEEATRAIKRELLAGRPVIASIFDDSSGVAYGRAKFTDPQTRSQYTVNWDKPGITYGAAHAITIVGWDDNWSVSNFLQGTIEASDGTIVNRQPPGPGAWIVRNSYGREGAGFPNEGSFGIIDPATGKHTGYFYVSYYDMSLSRPASFDFDVSGHKSDYINQHDLMPAPVPHTEKFEECTICANVFRAAADQMLHSLSVETEVPDTHVKLQLWRLREDAKSPTDGELLETVEADFEWGGFYRLKLSRGYRMLKGQLFSVVAELTTVGDRGSVVYHVPVHRDVNVESLKKYGKDAIGTYVKGVVNVGESFLLVDGAWVDWADLIPLWKQQGKLVWYYDYDNFSLKAYADAIEPEPEPSPALQQEHAYQACLATDVSCQVWETEANQIPCTGDDFAWQPFAIIAVVAAAVSIRASRVAIASL